jgi:hypothetical protein
MSDLVSVRAMIQLEETQYRRAITESLAQKLGKSINFINTRQYDSIEAMAAGQYGVVLTSLGVFPQQFCENYVAPVDIEVMGIIVHAGIVGSSGSTVLDIHSLTDNGATDNGTIFSVKPSVTSAVTDNLYGGKYYDPETATTVTFGSTPAGIVLGTFTTFPFPVDQGDALRFDIDSVMGGTPTDIALRLFIRPR